MRAAVLVVAAVLACGCTASKQSAPTPFPSLEPISDYFARLSPRPSVSPSASPTPEPGAQSEASSGAGPAPTSRASRPAAASRVSCPSGRVTADIDDFSASDTGDAPSSGGDHRYDVAVAGNASNGASASVQAVHLSVTVHANNGRASSYDVTVPQTIGPGSTVRWSGRFRYRAPTKPAGDESSVVVTGWSWASS